MTTIADVAKKAGVSPVTVSRVLNDSSYVHPDTRNRVEAVIAELNYVPSLAAQSLRSRRTKILALIVPDITNDFWTTVARGVEDVAQKHGYAVVLGNTDENPEKQRTYLLTVARQRVDGLILAPADRDPSTVASLIDRGFPTLLMDRAVDGIEVDTIRGDSLGGAEALVEHLIRIGYRKIAIINGPQGASTAQDRLQGYKNALSKHRLPLNPDWIVWGEFKASSGKYWMERLLELEDRPEAVFAANNLIGYGVLESLTEKAMRIPEDIALVCFDEMGKMGEFLQFFTVAVQPAYLMGVNAAERIIERIEKPDRIDPLHRVFPTQLHLRSSCGRFLCRQEYDPFSLLTHRPAKEEVIEIPVGFDGSVPYEITAGNIAAELTFVGKEKK